ncbi:hypothetical protein B0H14DRAFT_2636554 [Mycena olivaceomarginata]|nr:hypothetical protein B0H14DRAFT_2636554 [Mycena olivaceomarginata]
MIADMISMMSDHGIRVEIVPLQPPSIFGIIRSLAVEPLTPSNDVQRCCWMVDTTTLNTTKKAHFRKEYIDPVDVLFRILKNPLSSHLHWLNFATKLGNLFCMTSSTMSPNSVESNSIFRTEHFSSAVVATNTFQELGYATALRKYLLQGAVSVSEFKVNPLNNGTSRPDPRAVGGAHPSSKGSTEELNVPRILGKNFPIAEGIRLRENSPSGPKVPSLERGTSCLMWVEHGTQFADASMESTPFQRIEKMEPRELRAGGNSIGIPFGTIGTLATSEARGVWGPSKLTKAITRHWDRRFSQHLLCVRNFDQDSKSTACLPDRLSATQWTTGLSGSLDHLHQKQAEVPVIFTRENCGLKAKQMVNHDLDEPGTCRNLRELANVGHCCGRLNIGIGIRACHPQNCQSACPVTEWNEMELSGVNCWHQQSLQDLQATGSGLLAQWKLHVKSENEEVETIRNKITKVLEIRSKAITGLPASSTSIRIRGTV